MQAFAWSLQHGALRVIAGLLISWPRALTALVSRDNQVESYMAFFDSDLQVTHFYKLCTLSGEAGVKVTLGRRIGNTDPISP